MPPRKPPARRQNRSTQDAEVVELAPAPSVPEPDRGWLADTADQWHELWDSELAAYIRATDMPALRRLFSWRDELVRSRRKARTYRKEAEGAPLVPGSTGQMVANPLFALADKLDDRALSIESKIVALEDRLALSPKARLALGLTEQKGMNLAAQNARIAAALREAVTDAPDPRALPRNSAVDAS